MKDSVFIKSFTVASYEYQEEIALRDRVLRKPLNLEINETDLAEDGDSHHLGGFIDNVLIACLLLTPADEETIKIRQVVVDEEFQEQGIGKKLMEVAEDYARDHNYLTVRLMARATAVEFYEKIGYVVMSAEFIDERTQLPHRYMAKDLGK